MLNKINVRIRFNIIRNGFFICIVLGASSGGSSGAEKGLYDLGTYFGMYLLKKND
jgi:hypothetical protein